MESSSGKFHSSVKYYNCLKFENICRKICPFKEGDDEKVEKITPWNNNLHQLALDLMKGKCGLKEVQQRLGIETTNGVKVEA